MRYYLIPVLFIVLLGCSSREKMGRTAADVWQIGEALENHTEEIPPATLKLMGGSLKAIADRWAEDLGVRINKETGVE